MLPEYAALFLTAFAAATILPVASEVPLALVAARDGVALPVTVATAGNVLGACTTYALARWGVSRLARSPRPDRARTLVARVGAPALLLSWVPILGDAIVLLAGASGVRVVPFLVWTVIGKAARYWVVARAVAA